METIKVSKCCGAKVVKKGINGSQYIANYCQKCNRQCLTKKVCADCDGMQLVQEGQFDDLRLVPCISCTGPRNDNMDDDS